MKDQVDTSFTFHIYKEMTRGIFKTMTTEVRRRNTDTFSLAPKNFNLCVAQTAGPSGVSYPIRGRGDPGGRRAGRLCEGPRTERRDTRGTSVADHD